MTSRCEQTHRRTRAPYRVLGVALVSLTVAACPPGRPIPSAAPRVVAGAELLRTPRSDGAMRLEGVAGDLRLANEQVFAVVSAAPAKEGFRSVPGRLVDLRAREVVDDLLQSLSPAVRIDDGSVRLEVRSVTATARGVEVVSDVPERPELEVRTVYGLGARAGHVEVTTEVTNAGPKPVDVTGGDDVYLGNVVPFVPGHGDADSPGELSGHWFGYAARGQAFVYGKGGGEPFDLEVRYLTIGDSKFTGAVRTKLARRQVEPAASLSWRSWVTTGGSLGAASERLFAAARTSVRVLRGQVDPMRAGLQVEVVSDSRPFTRVTPARDGSFSVALPPGPFQLATLDREGMRGPEVAASPDRAGAHRLRPPESGIVEYRVIGGRGEPLGARLVLIGPGGRRTVYSETGQGSLRLAPGDWRILAVRGFEHELDERAVHVAAGSAPVRVELKLRRAVKTPGWVSADMHLHAEGSGDSEVRFPARVRSLVAEGVEVAVSTEHNRVADYGPAVRALGLEQRIRVLSGSEVSTTGEARWGHFNAFPLDEPAPHHDMLPGALFQAIRNGGSRVIQVNHPRMPPRIGYFDLVGLDPATGTSPLEAWSDDFDVIEVFNGIWLAHPDRVRRNLDDWFALLNRGQRVAATGNSDSHKLVVQEVGWPRTYLQTGEDAPGRLTQASIVGALQQGRTLVTTGPFVRMTVDGEGPGGTVHAGARATLPLEVWVHAPTWVPVTKMRMIVDGESVWELPIPPASSPLRLHGRFDVRVEGAHWIVVQVDGGTHTSPAAPVEKAWSVAFTSPVYVDHAESSPLHSPTDSHARFDR